MKTYIALLRAVNLAGRNTIAMTDLRGLCAGVGLEDAQTLLQSGNVVFRSEARGGALLERRLEVSAKRRLGLETTFFVRSAEEWAALIAGNPFREEARRDPGHLLVVCLRDAPSRESVAALRAAVKGREVVAAKGRAAYVVYPDGVGRSRLTTALIEKKLGTVGTGRNWNTVTKLARLAGAEE